MNWEFLLGTTIIIGTIAGIFWLRTHAPDDDVSRPTRPVSATAQRTRRVLRLLFSDASGTAADVRRRLRIPRADFYDLMDHMIRRHLVETHLVAPFQYGYRLTDDGVHELERADD